MGGPVEDNLENYYILSKSGCGNKHGSCNVQNGSNTAVNIHNASGKACVQRRKISGSCPPIKLHRNARTSRSDNKIHILKYQPLLLSRDPTDEIYMEVELSLIGYNNIWLKLEMQLQIRLQLVRNTNIDGFKLSRS